MKRVRIYTFIYRRSSHSKRRFYSYFVFLILLIALAGCRKGSQPNEKIVKTWEPGQSMYDERGLQRREYIVDGTKQTVFACTDFLTESEIFKLGITKVHYEFGDQGLPLSDFEKRKFDQKAYSLIQFFDEEDQQFKSMIIEKGVQKYLDSTGNKVDEGLWNDLWPRDGCLLSWDKISHWLDDLMRRSMPYWSYTVDKNGYLIEYEQGDMFGDKPVVSLYRIFGPPVRVEGEEKAIPMVTGSNHIHYANAVFYATGQPIYIVYFERFRVYLDPVKRVPWFAVDERTGKLAYVYYYLIQTEFGAEQQLLEIIWRKKVDAKSSLTGPAVADVYLDGDRVLVEKKSAILSKLTEPQQNWDEVLSKALEIIHKMEKHVPLIPRGR